MDLGPIVRVLRDVPATIPVEREPATTPVPVEPNPRTQPTPAGTASRRGAAGGVAPEGGRAGLHLALLVTAMEDAWRGTGAEK